MGARTCMTAAALLALGSAGAQEVPTIPVTPPAGEAQAPPAGEEKSTALDDIVVTAERRPSTVQDTPISIDAFDADKLQLRGIEGLADLSANVPSMTIEPFPTHNATLRLFIRGVGVSDAQVTQDPAVGVYLDGVYIARSVGLALDIADLERIEVLRGPQGTLYGRNTTGGAINLITRRPLPGAFSMAHTVTLGNRNLYLGKSSFNVPLGDDLAVKLALLGKTRDGFVENTGPGGDYGDRREVALRFDARWLPTHWLTADYGFDHSDLEYYNYSFQAVLGPATNHGQAEAFKPFAVANTVYSDRRLGQMATGMPLEPSRSRVTGHALTLAAPFAGGYEVKYVGAYRALNDDQYVDLGGGAGSLEYRLDTHFYDGPGAAMAQGSPAAGPTELHVPFVYQDQWSHELQLSGRLFDDERLTFIVGGFDFIEDGGEDSHPIHHIINTALDPQGLADVAARAPPGLRAALVALASPRLSVFWDYDFQIHNEARALFGQMTWTPPILDERLRLTVGARQSWDRRDAVKNYVQKTFVEGQAAGQGLVAFELPRSATPGADVFDGVRASKKYRNFSPSFNLQFDATPDATLYLSVASAYKSGGYNVRDPQISGASGPASDGIDYGFGFVDGFRPEHVRSYELGLKSTWFKRRLRFNADIFDSHYRDMQTNFLVVGSISETKSRNAGKAQMRGLEMDLAVVPADDLVVSLNYAHLDAEVTEVIDINGDNVAHLYPFISAPPHSGVAAVDWTFLRGGWGDLRSTLSWHYVGPRNGLVITEERRGKTAIPGYGLLGARLGAGGFRLGGHGTVDLALWGKNLADEEYPLTAIDNLPQADRAVIWGEPRSVGMDFIYRWF